MMKSLWPFPPGRTLGVNYEGWDSNTLRQFLAAYGFSDQETAESVFQAVVQDPANYLSYYVGMMEFQQLRQKAEETLGENFEAMEFHRTVLDVGPAPFAVVEQAVDAYIAGGGEQQGRRLTPSSFLIGPVPM